MSNRTVKTGLRIKDYGPITKDYGPVVYLRVGRKHRATGRLRSKTPVYVSAGGACFIVKPDRANWRCIHVSESEIAAASDRPIVKRAANRTRNGEVPKPKPKPVPRWKSLVKEMRHYAASVPASLAHLLLTEAADEIEHCHSQPHLI